MLDPNQVNEVLRGIEVSYSIAPLIVAGIGAGIKGIASWLGQKNANKQQQAKDAEAARQDRNRYDINQTRYNAAVQRRANTTNFIKAIAKQRGLDLPDSVWGLLSADAAPFPAYSAPLPGYRPNSGLAGLAGAATGGLETYSTYNTRPGVSGGVSKNAVVDGMFPTFQENPSAPLGYHP